MHTQPSHLIRNKWLRHNSHLHSFSNVLISHYLQEPTTFTSQKAERACTVKYSYIIWHNITSDVIVACHRGSQGMFFCSEESPPLAVQGAFPRHCVQLVIVEVAPCDSTKYSRRMCLLLLSYYCRNLEKCCRLHCLCPLLANIAVDSRTLGLLHGICTLCSVFHF